MTDWDDGWGDDLDESGEDDCAHEDYDVDWEGSATCSYCHASWWLTEDQLLAHHEAEARWMEEYDRMQRREHSRFWRAVESCRGFIQCLRVKFRPRQPAADNAFDDLPF